MLKNVDRKRLSKKYKEIYALEGTGIQVQRNRCTRRYSERNTLEGILKQIHKKVQ